MLSAALNAASRDAQTTRTNPLEGVQAVQPRRPPVTVAAAAHQRLARDAALR